MGKEREGQKGRGMGLGRIFSGYSNLEGAQGHVPFPHSVLPAAPQFQQPSGGILGCLSPKGGSVLPKPKPGRERRCPPRDKFPEPARPPASTSRAWQRRSRNALPPGALARKLGQDLPKTAAGLPVTAGKLGLAGGAAKPLHNTARAAPAVPGDPQGAATYPARPPP